MARRYPDAAQAKRCDGDAQTEAFGDVRLLGHDRKDITDLAALVEKAVAMADASGFDLVGIDLCSALERLRKMGEPSCRVGQRDCE